MGKREIRKDRREGRKLLEQVVRQKGLRLGRKRGKYVEWIREQIEMHF